MKSSEKSVYITGKVTASKYLIGIPSEFSIYYKNKSLNTVKTDKYGKFNMRLKNKFCSLPLKVIIKPQTPSVYKDTIIKHLEIEAIRVERLSNDTITIENCSELKHIETHNYLIMEYSSSKSH